jgi:DNA-binding CsgD family transcriptional regulator
MDGLLERSGELAVVGAVLERCVAGAGGVLVVEGPAGIGKTALLDSTHALAREAGIRVLSARGGELEREFAHAVVRQLFEPALASTDERERAVLLGGAAGLATPVLAADARAAPAPIGDQAFAVAHGLYWLTANLAKRGPLLLVVDDGHWCDRPSLSFLLYLVRRLEGLPVAIALGARTHEPGGESELLEQIAAEPAARALAPAPLSVKAVGELVAASLGDHPAERFVLACHDATGGNPFLACELLGALARDGIAPSAGAVAAVGELGPKTVRRAIVLRLARLPRSAGALAQSAAVLGAPAELRHAAALARLDDATAAACADALADVQILKAQLPLEFAHPIVRAAVYEDMAPAARSLAHARAARLLASEHADPERVAAHLNACEPTGETWIVEQLRLAASLATARGAPQAACSYLRRALAEPPPAPDRPRLLYELGRTEALARDPRAVARLHEALGLSEEPGLRGRIAEALIALLVFSGDWDAAASLAGATLRELGDGDPDAAARLETLRAATSAYDPRFVEEFDRDHRRLSELARRGGPASRPLSLLLAAVSAWRMEDLDRVAGLVERGLDGGRLLAQEGAEAWSLGQAVTALVALDELDSAERLADRMLADATARGAVLGVSAGASFRGYVRARRGALREAEADFRVGFQLALEHGLTFALPSIFSYAVDVLPERPELADIAEHVELTELPPAFEHTASGALLLEVRGRLRLLRGDAPAAIADLSRCGEIFDALRLTNPLLSSWRPALALALRTSEPERAAQLLAEALELAGATGLPRPLGVAQRAAGLLAGGERGIELLRDALATLERAPSALERARAAVELGGALRRAGKRPEARERLRAGLQLARRCGAQRLAEHAEQELRTAGAKPRRLAFSGVESLTASERRIAEMVAHGMTNQQAAEALFVTAKTVENHLGRVYHKLGIHSRERLAQALRAAGAPVTARETTCVRELSPER